MNQCIAERSLVYSPKGGTERKPLIVRVFAPSKVPDQDAAQCTVSFDGLPGMDAEQVFGADTLQALQLAVDIEPILKRLSKKYDFFFPTGEEYFDP